MEKKVRTFKQVEKEKTLEELNYFAKKVTELYANSSGEYTQEILAKDNNLTVKGVRDLMDYAIVRVLVSREITSKVLEKAIRNQRSKNRSAGGSSLMHHRKLIRQREENLANTFSKVEIRKIAEEITSQPSKTISSVTKKYKMESDRVTKLLLQRGIVENIVSDEVMEAVIRRSLKNNETQIAKQYFDNLRKEREKTKIPY